MLSTFNATIYLVMVFYIKSVAMVEHTFCPMGNVSVSGNLMWKRNPSPVAYACVERYTELYCCAQGYKSLLWYQKRDQEWELVQLSRQRYFKSSYNQTLIITSADYDIDEGKYSCVATDYSGKTIVHNTTLALKECLQWNQPPIVFQPSQLFYESFVGDNISIPCSAFYGDCLSNTSCSVNWYKVYKNKTVERIHEGNGTERIYVQIYTQQFKSTGKINTLFISSIEKGDFSVYRCVANSSYGSKQTDVSLIQKYDKVKRENYIVLSCLGIFLILVVVFFVIVWPFKLHIKVMYKDRFVWREPSKAKKYDAAIIYCEDCEADKQFVVDKLYEKLTEKYKYKVWLLRDIMANENNFKACGEIQDKTHCFIFVLSPKFFNNSMCIKFFEEAVPEKFQNFIFIEFVHLCKETEKQLCAKLKSQQVEPIFKAKEPTKLKWPPLNDKGVQSKRKLDLFWLGLRDKLPPKVKPMNIKESQILEKHCNDDEEDMEVVKRQGKVNNGDGEMKNKKASLCSKDKGEEENLTVLCSATEYENVGSDDNGLDIVDKAAAGDSLVPDVHEKPMLVSENIIKDDQQPLLASGDSGIGSSLFSSVV